MGTHGRLSYAPMFFIKRSLYQRLERTYLVFSKTRYRRNTDKQHLQCAKFSNIEKRGSGVTRGNLLPNIRKWANKGHLQAKTKS